MHTRVIQLRRGPTILVRPLRNGDIGTVHAVLERLGAGPCPSDRDPRGLATVDGSHHAIVAFVEGDPLPVAIAGLARKGAVAELTFAVADEYRHRGIGSALAAELVTDARAAGITEIRALTAGDNRATLAVLRRFTDVLDIELDGRAVSIRAVIA